MSFTQFQNRVSLFTRIAASEDIVMMSCRRCESKNFECKFSFFLFKCSHCVLIDEKCQIVEMTSIDFFKLDRVFERLEQEELNAKIAINAAIEQWKIVVEQIRSSRAKLRRLRKQKKFLKNREKKLLDKDLFEIEKFERLEKFEKINEVQRVVEIAFFVNEFFTFVAFFFGSLFWLNQFVVDEILEKVLDNF